MIKVLNILNKQTLTSIPYQLSKYIEDLDDITIDNLVIRRRQLLSDLKSYISNVKKVDVVHSHQTFSALFVSLFYLLSKCTFGQTIFIHTVHRNFKSFSWLIQCIYLLFILPFRTAIIVNSQTTFDSLPFLLKQFKKVFIVYNGVDFSQIQSSHHKSEEVLKIVSVARMVAIKDQITILKALAEINQREPGKVELHFYGDGPESKRLNNYVVENGLENCIFFHGMVTRDVVYANLKNYHIAVMSSLNEGFGVSTIEAAAAGLVVLASDIPIHREILGDGKWLFPLKDDKALAQLIRFYSENKEERKRIAYENIKKSKTFSIFESAEQFKGIYTQLILNKR